MIIFSYTVSILLMLALPLLLAVGLRRRHPSAWILFSLGSLTFIAAQLVHLPLNDWLAELGWLPGEAQTPVSLGIPAWRAALILGLTAGLTEELARALGYAALERFKPAWLRIQDAVMLGLGHGGIEAMVFGGVLLAASLSALLPLQGVDLGKLNFPPEQLGVVQAQLANLEQPVRGALLPLVERILAMAAQVVFSLLVWKSFARGSFRRDWGYLLAAVLYHALVDFAAVMAVLAWNLTAWQSELVLLAVVAPGFAWAAWTWRRQAPAATRTRSAWGQSGRYYLTALRKELLQEWRTRRALVVLAVFLVFGMGSPLLAKLTPEIIGSFAEAQMFADLIPEPTALDGMVQYIKNLTQFGFVLAVLLAMGAVVGEKERGVAQMILSKPLPRWAFLLSKFTAQALIYLAAFLLAGLGAYYYSYLLFGALDFSYFAAVNGLLWIWLLVFVALALVGSVLGKSTGAAGGIGMLLSVAALLAGNLPRVGSLAPGGLTGWATLLSQKAAGLAPAQYVSNAGALAMAGVIILMALATALGVFEQQEL